MCTGIPLGLAGFKLKDRDKKDRDKKARLSVLLHKSKQASPLPNEPDGGVESSSASTLAPGSSHRLFPSISHSPTNHLQHQTTSGWSYILDDWFCRGVGAMKGAQPVLSQNPDHLEDDSPQGSPINPAGTIGLSWRTENASPLSASHVSTASDVGPYELLAKERLMGIYLAVFIHRELRPLIRGLFFT